MAHLTCRQHKHRVFVSWEDGQYLGATHRKDGTKCDDENFQIGSEALNATQVAHRSLNEKGNGS